MIAQRIFRACLSQSLCIFATNVSTGDSVWLVSLLRRLLPHSTLFVKNAFGGFPSPACILRGVSIFTFIESALFFSNHVWNRKPFSPSRSFQTTFSVCIRALNSSTSSESTKPSSNLVPCCCPNMSAIMHFLLGSSTPTVLR